MEPEEAVRYAVANAALDGRGLDGGWQEILLQVAKAVLTPDDAIASVIQEGAMMSEP